MRPVLGDNYRYDGRLAPNNNHDDHDDYGVVVTVLMTKKAQTMRAASSGHLGMLFYTILIYLLTRFVFR
jgi:hypothetical protein